MRLLQILRWRTSTKLRKRIPYLMIATSAWYPPPYNCITLLLTIISRSFFRSVIPFHVLFILRLGKHIDGAMAFKVKSAWFHTRNGFFWREILFQYGWVSTHKRTKLCHMRFFSFLKTRLRACKESIAKFLVKFVPN